MRTRTVPLILSIALVTTMAPVALANHAGHTYEDEGSFERPAIYAVTAVREYVIQDVPQDADLSATLTWDDDPTVDMDVELVPPAGTCAVTPAPEVFCLVESVPAHAENASCGGDTDPRSPDDAEREAAVTTDRSGAWTVAVQATLLPPGESVDYDVSFTVGADHGDLSIQDVNYIQSDPHCFLVE